MTFIFINGSIDFSVTAILGLSSIFGATILKLKYDPAILIPAAILAMLATGVAIGLLNGLSVAKLKMPSFIATMATQLVFSGLALTITRSKSIGGIPKAFNRISQGSIFYIPSPIYTMVVVLCVCAYLLNQTVFGRRIIAVGTNQNTSRISGIPVEKTIIRVFVISGFLAALASIVMTARLGAGLPALGKDMLMDIVAAVVIGGTAVTGGKGDMIGTAIGAIFVITLNNSLNLLEMEWFFINVCKGVLVLVVALYIALRVKSES
jgi:ribose transport system permease protein